MKPNLQVLFVNAKLAFSGWNESYLSGSFRSHVEKLDLLLENQLRNHFSRQLHAGFRIYFPQMAAAPVRFRFLGPHEACRVRDDFYFIRIECASNGNQEIGTLLFARVAVREVRQ